MKDDIHGLDSLFPVHVRLASSCGHSLSQPWKDVCCRSKSCALAVYLSGDNDRLSKRVVKVSFYHRVLHE